MKYLGRSVLTLAVAGMLGVVETITTTTSTILSGNLAGLQFENSNLAPIINDLGQNTLSTVHSVFPILTLGLVILIWVGPLMRAFEGKA